MKAIELLEYGLNDANNNIGLWKSRVKALEEEADTLRKKIQVTGMEVISLGATIELLKRKLE